jgi:hypothetical protein
MWDDVLVVAPYNVQVTLLGERLASRGVRVGTVDKFLDTAKSSSSKSTRKGSFNGAIHPLLPVVL